MSTTETEAAGTLVVRPRKVRFFVIPVAVALLVVFVVVAALLKHGSTGVRFDTADQFSLAAIGVVLALGTLVFVRPRVVANAEGVHVRNALWGQTVPWSIIKAVSFPDGAPWARLELPADEYVPIVAIQATDGERAVLAIRELRALHRRYAEQPKD
ncbi:MAG TPA: PH domain-containing protein [Pseudonocardiaceae bacterium]|nr:PH domain-containing protein [Pseudonocardiaceae bacterium]